MSSVDPRYLAQLQQQQLAQQTWYSNATTSNAAITAIYPQLVGSPAPQRTKELGPVEWLRGQVDEVCELAVVA